MSTNLKQYCEKMFKDALVSLAIDAEEQVRITEPGDVPFEIIDDYLSWSEYYLKNFESQQKPDVVSSIKQLREAVENLPESVFCKDNLTSMKQPQWQAIREHAQNLLVLLGWPSDVPSPFISEGNGVYRRP